MKRAECIAMLYPELDDKLVVTIMGACAQELYDLGHRDNFFYLQHAMGLASSIGLGLAMHLPAERVVVLDGDGSVLMNLGTLATLARYRPRNLVHIIFDNGSLLSTGGFDSHTTSGITDLAAIARGAGIEHVTAVDSVMEFGEAVMDAFDARRSERDRREGRGRRPEPLRDGPAPARERVPVQAVDRRTEEEMRETGPSAPAAFLSDIRPGIGDEAVAVRHLHFRQALGVHHGIFCDDAVEVQDVRDDRVDFRRLQQSRADRTASLD